MREVLKYFNHKCVDIGITPACAGSIRQKSKRINGYWDHPRVCGKYSSCASRFAAPPGSPPRVREVLCKSFSMSIVYGITPACAGSIVPSPIISTEPWDHPRVCGKYGNFYKRTTLCKGSPPRVREVLN